MATVDITEKLKAARAARSAAQKEPKTFTIGPPIIKKAKTFTLVPSLRWDAAEFLSDGRFRPFMESMLGGNGQMAEFDALKLDMDDFAVVVEEITALYGPSAGESSASSSS